MQYSSLELIWAIIVVIFVLLVLASSILLSMITHSRKTRKSEEKFRALFERVFDALLLINKDGMIVDVNDSAIGRLGYSRDEFRGNHIRNLVAEDRFPEFDRGFIDAFKGKSIYLGEYELQGNNGAILHAEVGCAGLEIHEQNYVLASLRDITGRKLAERKLRDKNVALKAVLASLEEEKLKIKKQISGNVDHVLMPALEKMINVDGSVNLAYYRSLKQSLSELALLSADISDQMAKLSPRETEISKLTRNGLTAKEIAKALNITVATVEKHREKIRKKLKISKTKTNLSTHLKRISRVGL